jgi:hypothetical protein
VLLFGLVLRGRFDEEAGDAGDAAGLAFDVQRRPARVPLLALALGVGAVGLLLTLIFDGGALLGLGILGLLACIALASVAIVSDAAATTSAPDPADGPQA